jgi:hypothetical protein
MSSRWSDNPSANTAPSNVELRVQIDTIRKRFEHRVEEKYLAGQEEHGGNLFKKARDLDWLLTQLEDEAIDLFVYVQAARAAIREGMAS